MDYKGMVDENFSGEPEIGEEAWEKEQEGLRILREEMEKVNALAEEKGLTTEDMPEHDLEV